jgi:aldehyde dehydrogenase (NAD+)
LLATLEIAPAIAAGNAIVVKPSELTPYSVIRLAQLGHEAGLPHGIIGIVPGLGQETGRALVRHPLVKAVAFTGSGATGAQVMADGATGPKPVWLELGGKSPQVVFPDAEIPRVAEIVARFVCRNAGQSCFAGTRLVVHETVAAAVTAQVVDQMKKVVCGPTWSTASTLAPIVSSAQCARIEDIVRRGVEDGATIVSGGSRADASGGGIHYQPTVVTEASPHNPIVREEVFGPVLAVQTFREIEQAVALVNDSPFGLAAGIHTKDLKTAIVAARSIQAGMIWVNEYGAMDPAMPFGGYNQSGFGKDMGAAALERCLRTKSISIRL